MYNVLLKEVIEPILDILDEMNPGDPRVIRARAALNGNQKTFPGNREELKQFMKKDPRGVQPQ